MNVLKNKQIIGNIRRMGPEWYKEVSRLLDKPNKRRGYIEIGKSTEPIVYT